MLNPPKDSNFHNGRTGGSIQLSLHKVQKIPEVEFQYAFFMLIQRRIVTLPLCFSVFFGFLKNKYYVAFTIISSFYAYPKKRCYIAFMILR